MLLAPRPRSGDLSRGGAPRGSAAPPGPSGCRSVASSARASAGSAPVRAPRCPRVRSRPPPRR
eukprot:9930743-Alexandrium_andersonii.AAC.1